MYTYSIIPLEESFFDDIVNDVRDQYRRKISTLPLFKMVLVPEGNPVWNKVDGMCELYARFKKALAPDNIKTGVLVQASLGHGYEIVPNPFQPYIRLTDGKSEFCCCPEDEKFIEHFSNVLKRVAMEHPDAIMLDDDFRMTVRPGRGCACPLHLEEFKKLTGLDMTQAELYEYVTTHPDGDPITLKYLETQRNSLVKAATAFRKAIDSVDPSIQGINCTSGPECDSVIYTNPIFAGKGNPTIVRVPNGSYAPETVRKFSDCMSRAAICSSKLRKNGIDIILAETDTVPFNRYGKSSHTLHAQYTSSILEGIQGAKHWITRFSAGEQNSGKAYRDILSEHSDFYEKLSGLVKGIRWTGAGSVFTERKYHCYNKKEPYDFKNNDWVTLVLERMGIPFYFQEENNGCAFVEGNITRDMTDAQIENLFNGSVFLASDAAKDLANRGYSKYLGVQIEEWTDGMVNGECFDEKATVLCTKQKNYKLLIPDSDKTETISYNYRVENGEKKLISPAVTVFKRDDKITVVYCGSPTAEFNYREGFAFLNESRKNQFVSLLSQTGELPAYYHGDNEVCMRVGYTADGKMLIFLLLLGTDSMEDVSLYFKSKPSSVKIIEKDGTEKNIEYREAGNNIYSLHTRLEQLYPVVLIAE